MIHSGRKTTVASSFPLNQYWPVNNLAYWFNTSSCPGGDYDLCWWWWWGGIAVQLCYWCRCFVVNRDSAVCKTTVLSRMLSYFMHFSKSLIHTSWFLFIFSYHWFPFSISHLEWWQVITHSLWDTKLFKTPPRILLRGDWNFVAFPGTRWGECETS